MPGNAPELSIIIPTYNVERYIAEALSSLLEQTHTNFELLVVDDGSTDETIALARSFIDPRIRIIAQSSNRGPAYARNQAIEVANGQFIGFFDADDVASPQLFEEQLALLKRKPELQGTSVWHEPIDPTGRSDGVARGYADAVAKIPSTLLFENCLCTSGMTIRRTCIGNNRFDEKLPVASDYELWTRIVAIGAIGVHPKPLVKYRVHINNLTHRKQNLAEKCLREIAARQLRRLGIDPTATELDLHREFTKVTYGTTRQTVMAAERWLKTLEQKNADSQIYENRPFREVLNQQWFRICYSACSQGFWTHNTFYKSQLVRYNRPSISDRHSFLVLVLRGAIKRQLVKMPLLLKPNKSR